MDEVQQHQKIIIQRLTTIATTIILVLSLITASSFAVIIVPEQAKAQGQPQEQRPGSQALTYVDSVCGIRIQYPSNWEGVGLGSDGVDLFVPQTDIGLSIYISQSPTGQSLDRFVSDTINSLKQDLGQNFQLIESGKTTIVGDPAYGIVYRFKEVLSGGLGLGGVVEENNEQQQQQQKQQGEVSQQTVITKTKDIFTIKGNKVYTLSYSAPEAQYATYLPITNKMISTFGIGTPSAACQPLELGEFGGGAPGTETGGSLPTEQPGNLERRQQQGTTPGEKLQQSVTPSIETMPPNATRPSP